MNFDVARVRADFPALESGLAFFDAPGGTQTPIQVSETIATALRAPLSNRGLDNPAQRNADQIVVEARAALGDFLGNPAEAVVFGRSATQLTMDFAHTLARRWLPGDEVVVTRLDHDANIRPWLIAAARVGATVRWVDFDPTTAELDLDQLAASLTERTRVVAATGASNLVGTIPDLPAIAGLAHSVGALFWVDGVHLAAHARIDRVALGADVVVCSPYKFCGPHLGVLAADPALLAELRPDKLLPSADAVPEQFELGTLPYELLAGTTAAVDFLADLGGGGTRTHRLDSAFARLHAHEHALQSRLETGLAERGAILYSRAERRTSTVLFDLPGRAASEVALALAAVGVTAPAGHFYALEASRHLGLGDRGAVRAGLAPYTDASDVDQLLTGLDRLCC
ncbi:MAG: cysteine desulfurase-like protein [Microlunatus sp.]|nr:cysteine desulfurase-like protein [Microlunatus sp.]